MNDLAFGWRKCVNDVGACEAYADGYAAPVGIVWYRKLRNGRDVEILDSYTRPDCRRQGVRTAIHRQLLAAFPKVERIVSDHGTREGRAWMLATGYRERDGWWVYRRKGA